MRGKLTETAHIPRYKTRGESDERPADRRRGRGQACIGEWITSDDLTDRIRRRTVVRTVPGAAKGQAPKSARWSAAHSARVRPGIPVTEVTGRTRSGTARVSLQ